MLCHEYLFFEVVSLFLLGKQECFFKFWTTFSVCFFNRAHTIELPSRSECVEYDRAVSCVGLDCPSRLLSGARTNQAVWLQLVATENRLGLPESEAETKPCLFANLSCVG